MKRAHKKRLSRRGFVFPVVALLTFVATMMLSMAYLRHNAQARIVTRQLAEYRRHHEMFGIRAILTQWLSKNFDSLRTLATEPNKRGAPDYGFILPSDVKVRMNVADGQGALLIDTTAIPDAQRETYEEILARVPRSNPIALRRVGPPGLSVNTAPRVVLEALLEERGEDLADKIIRRRADKPLEFDDLEAILRRQAGLSDDLRSRILEIVTFEPTLWRLDIIATDEQGDRRFQMLLEGPSAQMRVHEWAEVSPASAIADENSQKAGSDSDNSDDDEQSTAGPTDRRSQSRQRNPSP